MKVLWITNGLLPEAANAVGIDSSFGGGWMTSLLDSLRRSDIQIAVASSYYGKEILQKHINDVLYYYLPFGVQNIKFDNSQLIVWKEIEQNYKPDVVHIHGTEYSNGIGYIRANGSDKVVISIQGLVNAISKYENAGMPFFEKLKSITIGSILRYLRDGNKYSFKKRALVEIEYLKTTKYIIGRTLWDKSYSMTLNPEAHYFECGELLRPVFYSPKKWCYNQCLKHSIFISGGTPWLKGLYFLVKAISIVKKQYPDVKVFVAGDDFLHYTDFISLQKLTIDQRCIYNKAKELGVLEHFFFTGWLSETQIYQQYLNANVFVSASTIENSSNAICEAQILGCPIIASFVGGTPSLIKDGITGNLYRFDEERVLAFEIMKIFRNPQRLEFNDIEKRHEISANVRKIRSIYQQIINNDIIP